MAISETKMQIVIANYFKDECDVNTSIKQAFEKGFRIGVKKGANMNRPQGKWVNVKISISGDSSAECSLCGAVVHNNFSNTINFCPNCGADMRESN